jgi:enamine deaminase RidA (YjgF/YER057c/UK114 family)
MSTRGRSAVSLVGAFIVALTPLAHAADITRIPFPRPASIATETTVPGNSTLYYLSGGLPTFDPKAPGDTESQARSAIAKLVATLSTLGLKPSDVVKATVFLAGDPAKGGEMDFDGFSKAWAEVWPVGDPKLPARSTVKVAGLVLPGALIEIELIAARTK